MYPEVRLYMFLQSEKSAGNALQTWNFDFELKNL